MKQKFLVLIAVSAMIFAGCSSGGNKEENTDSLTQDSVVTDTADMGTTPTDTSTMRTDSLKTDTPAVQ